MSIGHGTEAVQVRHVVTVRCDRGPCREEATVPVPDGDKSPRADRLPAGWVWMRIEADPDYAAGMSHWERYNFILCPTHAPHLTVTVGTVEALR